MWNTYDCVTCHHQIHSEVSEKIEYIKLDLVVVWSIAFDGSCAATYWRAPIKRTSGGPGLPDPMILDEPRVPMIKKY